MLRRKVIASEKAKLSHQKGATLVFVPFSEAGSQVQSIRQPVKSAADWGCRFFIQNWNYIIDFAQLTYTIRADAKMPLARGIQKCEDGILAGIVN